jgi:predicted TIM-barrel fold metal-dependent hydrolase
MIDTHVHLIKPDLFSYPWLDDVPALEGAWTLSRWRPQAVRSGIVYGIFMEVDAASTDSIREARHFFEIADQDGSPLLGVVAACRPELPGFFEHLDQIEHPRLVGLRRVLHVAPPGTMNAPLFAKNLARLWTRNLSFDLCVRPDQLTDAINLVDACPDTQFVLDHAGNPPLGSDDMDSWRSSLVELGRRPNVACKISGLVNHIENRDKAQSAVRRILNHARDCFGPNRILFGGDWPVCLLAGYELHEWAELVETVTLDWSRKERDAFYDKNARRIYGLPEGDG